MTAAAVRDRIVADGVADPVFVLAAPRHLDDSIGQWVNLRSLRMAGERRERQAARLRSRPDVAISYLAPRTSAEREIAKIRQEMLGVAQVGVLGNFFSDLSGNSMLPTQFIARLRERFQVELPLRHVFDGPTIATGRGHRQRVCGGCSSGAGTELLPWGDAS